jgi:hypothetical protein
MGKIPTALRNKIWEIHSLRQYEMQCPVCNINIITTINFHCGHIIPESWGAPTELANLIPICKDCNLGMGNRYMLDYQLKSFGYENISYRLAHFNLDKRFLEILPFFQDQIEESKFKKHRCNFIPLNRKVKTCRKMCNYNQEYCPEHQELMNKRAIDDGVVPMDVD